MDINTLKKASSETTEYVQNLFYKARRNLLIHHPFTGSMALHLEVVVTQDERMKTSCTNGHSLYIDAQFFSNLKEELQMVVIAHNVWHCALLHQTRINEFTKDAFDYACDLEIDLLLYKDGFQFPVLPHNTAWHGLSVEQICRLLPKYIKRDLYWDMHIQEDESVPGVDSSILDEFDNEVKNNSSSNDAKKENSNSKEDKSFSSSIEEQKKLDKNSTNDKDDSDESNEESNEEGKDKSADFMSNLPNQDSNDDSSSDLGNSSLTSQIDVDFGNNCSLSSSDFPVEKWNEVVKLSIANFSGSGCGSMPGNITQILTLRNKETLRWQDILKEYLTLYFKGNRSWSHPNRRHIYRNLYLPGVAKELSIDIFVAIDTSGSTVPYLDDFLAEINKIFTEYSKYKVLLIQCSDDIEDVEEYSTVDGNIFPCDKESLEFGFSGGGGTSLIPPFEYVTEKLDENPECLIYFTDGFGPAPILPPNYPVVWVLLPDGVKPADWGEVVYMNERKNDEI